MSISDVFERADRSAHPRALEVQSAAAAVEAAGLSGQTTQAVADLAIAMETEAIVDGPSVTVAQFDGNSKLDGVNDFSVVVFFPLQAQREFL